MFLLRDNQVGAATAVLLDNVGNPVIPPPGVTFHFVADDPAILTVTSNEANPGAQLNPVSSGLTGLTTTVKAPDGSVLSTQHDDVEVVPTGLRVDFSILP